MPRTQSLPMTRSPLLEICGVKTHQVGQTTSCACLIFVSALTCWLLTPRLTPLSILASLLSPVLAPKLTPKLAPLRASKAVGAAVVVTIGSCG